MSGSRNVEILETSMGNYGSETITGAATSPTSPVALKYTALQFMEDSTITSQTDAGVSNADLTAITTIAAGSVIYGRWSAITVGTGTVIAYLGR